MKHHFAIFCFLFSSLFASELTYQFGHGIQISNLPLYVGGYSSLAYNHVVGGNQSLKLDELALLLYGEHDRFSYMLEMEGEDIYTEMFGSEDSEVRQRQFHIERLYVNYDFDENYAIKIGKYSSPIGFWNISPINVLRATTSDPLIATKLFPSFTSGIEFEYQALNTNSLTLTGFLQHNKDIDNILYEDPYNNFNIDRHYGLGISFEDGPTTYQLNAGYFHLPTNQSYSYIEGSFKTDLLSDTIQGEIGTQFIDDRCSLSYIGYIQWVHSLKEHHESIVRVESYNDRLLKTDDTFVVVGYTYRPYDPVALKAEYQWHSRSEKNQMLLSASVLF